MALLFLYGTSLPGQPDHRWVTGLELRPATVRGALFRGPRNRPALLPDAAGKPIHGVLVDVDPTHLAVMDLVETAGQDLVHRAPVLVSSSLRSTHADAWVLRAGRRLPGGWRRLGADRWVR